MTDNRQYGEWTERPNGDTDPVAEQIARAFHERYEEAAPRFQYDTRPESAVPWEQVPENNRLLMIHTVRALILRGVIDPGPGVKRDAR